MDRDQKFQLCSHKDDFDALKEGDLCCVRWIVDGVKRWYVCTICTIAPDGCRVVWEKDVYTVTWDADEFIASPHAKIFEFIKLFPDACLIQIGASKYLLPSGRSNFKDGMAAINLLRIHRGEPVAVFNKRYDSSTLDAVAAVTKNCKIAFTEE